ncbi:arylsulfatase [Ruegeria lacuscaerulensis]|uniref:arylsulfatase n=1 Tax=Ruegeria lacuscaerulensis TaxID=55218 RepID=UPI00147CE4AB|nr:arylsulfatase [Ruegeria lacuscaerulensis]
MMGRTFIAFAVAVTTLFGTAAYASEKPNIVLVFMDNFGWGEPGFNGGGITRGAATPRLDQLAAEGLRLTNFNVESQCTPSRAAIMTGRYAVRTGNGTIPLGGGVYGLVQWEVTMAEMLSDAGYATGMFGKWHLGHTEGRFPTDQGFEEWYGIPNSSDETPWSILDGFSESGVAGTHIYEGIRGSTPQQVLDYDLEQRALIDGELTRRAIDFMARHAASETPFFLYLPYTMTHYPLIPHPDFAGSTGNGRFADVLAQIDAYNGMLLDAIDDLGIRDNTIFIFTADNGPEILPEGSNTPSVEYFIPGNAGPWRGSLFTGFEGSLRVPFAVRWPGKIPAGVTSDEIIHEMDLFPTFANIASGSVPDDRIIDGIDQTEFFLGNKEKSNREGVIVYMGNDVWGVKWRNWKVHLKEQQNILTGTVSYGVPRIYNLYKDPGETQNVLFPETWVPQAALKQLTQHAISLQKEPPIKPGTKDPYIPAE